MLMSLKYKAALEQAAQGSGESPPLEGLNSGVDVVLRDTVQGPWQCGGTVGLDLKDLSEPGDSV